MSWHVIHWNVASWRQSWAMFDTSPHQRRPMWLSVSSRSQGNDVIAFSPLYNCCSLFTPEPVMNSRGGKDRWQTLTYLRLPTHASSLTLKYCHSIQLHWLLFKKKKSSSSTCQLIDGVEGASPGCKAPPSKRHFRSNPPRPWFSEHSSSAACVSDC